MIFINKIKNTFFYLKNFLESIIIKFIDKEIPIGERKSIICKQFSELFGYEMYIDNPVTFNEKIQWYKLYYRNSLMTKCADKYAVRDYVKRTIGGKYLNELISVYGSVEEVNFNSLPSQFVLKLNHSAGFNLACKDTNAFDLNKAKEKMTQWIKPEYNFYHTTYEWCYKNIKPKIICEKYLGDDLADYRFFCFNGKVKLLYASLVSSISVNRKFKTKIFFDLDWNELPFSKIYEDGSKKVKKPKNFNKMIKLAEKLAKPFPFVRVDFYEVEDEIIFGELTFYPGNGMNLFNPIEWDCKIGDMFKLSSDNSGVCKLRRRLILKELQYGGFTSGVPRKKVSEYDPRSSEELKEGGMIGGDRMLHHGYSEKYAEYLLPFLRNSDDRDLVIVEVGILTEVGLAVWCDVFSKSRVIGLDIDLGHINNNMDNLKSLGAFENNKPELYEFDQLVDNTEYLDRVLKGQKIDIFIDDGLHTDESILKTLDSIKTHLAEDFVGFIEDNREIHDKLSEDYSEFKIDSDDELTVLTRV